MNNIKLIIPILAGSIFFSSCHSHNEDEHQKSQESSHAEHEHGSHENQSTATLTADQIKSINLEFGRIEKKQLTASLKANGILRVPNQNRANVTASMGGVVKTILVQTGNTVSKGQTIATISNNSFIILQEDYLITSSKTELAQADFERQKILNQGSASSIKSFQIAEAELKTLQAKKSSLQKQLELVGINTTSLSPNNLQSVVNITSPINGTVSNVMVNIGSYIEASNPIAEIVDNSQLHLDLFVYEKDLSKLKVGQTIHFTITNNASKEYDAGIYAISNTFESNTKAIAVHSMVKGDKQGLIDGMSITALVSLEDATVDAVPTNAIVSNEGQDYIIIEIDKLSEDRHSEMEEHDHDHDENGDQHKEDEHNHNEAGHQHDESKDENSTVGELTFSKIPVLKGTTDVGFSEITLMKDIPANSKIVVNGAFFILAKMTNQGEAHAH